MLVHLSGGSADGLQRRRRSDRAQPRGRARRKDRLYRRSRALQLSGPRRASGPVRQRDARPGVDREQRILLCLHDGIDFPTAFLGAIKAGIVPVAVNTMLSPEEFAFMLGDSRARAIVVSAPVLPAIQQAVALLPEPRPRIIVSDPAAGGGPFAAMLAASPGRGRNRVNPSRRALLLALFVGLDRAAEGHRPCSCQPDADCRVLCRPGARNRGE